MRSHSQRWDNVGWVRDQGRDGIGMWSRRWDDIEHFHSGWFIFSLFISIILFIRCPSSYHWQAARHVITLQLLMSRVLCLSRCVAKAGSYVFCSSWNHEHRKELEKHWALSDSSRCQWYFLIQERRNNLVRWVLGLGQEGNYYYYYMFVSWEIANVVSKYRNPICNLKNS